MVRSAILAAAFILSCSCIARADGGLRATPGSWWRAWNGDAFVLFNLALLAGWYLVGVGRLWRRAGTGRTIRPLQVGAYFAAWVTLLVVLVSPLDALSQSLSSAHMTQHLLLMNVAAPLFVLGSPTLVLAWGLPRDWRIWIRATPLAASLPWRPSFTWLVYATVLWAWHLPVLYHAALRDLLVHDMQHLSFFGAAYFYWRLLLDPFSRRRLHPAAAVLFLFTTSLHASVLGAWMTLSPQPWYADYARTTYAWGLTPLEDQQLAGLIMWIPACLIYPAAAAVLFGRWLAGLSSATQKRTPARHFPATEGTVA